MPTRISNKKFSVMLLVGAIIGCFSGVLLLGEILLQAARMFFGLTDDHWTTLIIPVIILAVLLVIGTAILVAAVFIEDKKLKWLTIAFSVGIPIVGEVIDLTIRVIILYNELNQHYGLV